MSGTALSRHRTSAFLSVARAASLVLLFATSAVATNARPIPNVGAASNLTSPPVAEAGKTTAPVHHQATSSKSEHTAPAKATPANPTPELSKTSILVVRISIVVLTILGALVSLYPIGTYVWVNWGWREHIISTSLSSKGKNLYLNFYHRDIDEVASADDRFDKFYNKWFGRSKLIVPALILMALVVIYSFFLACSAAQALYGESLIYLPLGHHIVKIAIAAVAGAYTMVTFDTITRVVKRDLLPEDIYVFTLRLVACVPVAYSLASFVKNDAAMVVAFATSTLSLQFIADFLRKRLSGQLGVQTADPTASDPVTLLSGIDPAVAERMGSIGVTTIWQLAESDPVQLTMRTNLSFTYVLDMTSQAIAWTYLEKKLEDLRYMGLGGACELGVLNIEANTPGSPYQVNAATVLQQAAAKLTMTIEQFKNVLHEIGDDPRTTFLIKASSE